MSNLNEVQAALQKLDVNNANHWTQDGLPRLDTVKLLASDQSITREIINQAAPGFTRATVANGLRAGANPASGVTPAAPPAAATPAPQATATPETVAPVVDPVVTQQPQAGADLDPVVPPLETPVVEDVQETQFTEAELLKKEFDHVTQEIEDMRAWKIKFDQEMAKKVARRDELIVSLQRFTPVQSNQQAIIDYLDSQKRLLEARRQKQLAVSGLRISDLFPQRAPIDQVMARKVGHGMGRPRVPVKR